MQNPLIPMIAITGRPDRARMAQLLDAYKSVGISQFLIYPRSGLEIEYMSEAWLNLCKNIVELAAERQMNVWLYDEYNWPSGNCCGQVTKGHEEFYPHALVFERKNGTIESRIVRNHIGADILNPDAVARFMSLTHQRYYELLKPYFGSVIKGIFTDEPSFGYFTSNNDGTLTRGKMDSNIQLLAWYEGLEADYTAVHGNDLIADVCAYMDGKPSATLWEDYYRIMGERMRKVYVGSMNQWCVDHGIVLTGHLMCEYAPESVRYNGDPLKMLCEFSQPGMDEIPTRVSFDDKGEMELSAMSLVQYAGLHKEHELAELFSLGPGEMNMATLRQMIWMTACYGVDRYIMAVAAVDPKGNVEKDSWYFPTSPTQPWFKFYPKLGASARLAAEAARKPYAPSVRLRYPSGLFMRLFGTTSGNVIGDLFVSLLKELVKGQVQYLYLGEDETSDIPVLSIDENGLFIEGEEGRFFDAEKFVQHVNTAVPRRCIVTDEVGNEVRNVMTRIWKDGTVALVDLTRDEQADRLLTIVVDGQEGHVRLPGHGVFCGKVSDMAESKPQYLCEAAVSDFSLSLKQKNLLRCLYTQSEPEIRLNIREDLEGLKLHLRKDPAPVSILLDGIPVNADAPDDRLPDGFTQLYRTTDAFSLSAGTHIIKVINSADAKDYRFLPSLFLSGDFELKNGDLHRFTGKGGLGELCAIRDYTDTFSLNTELNIPVSEKALLLSINTRGACTRVFLDGNVIGTRCWAPFEFEIPKEYYGGTHTLSVEITTSIMPLMGEYPKLEKEQPYADWVDIRSTAAIHPGLMQKPILKTR